MLETTETMRRILDLEDVGPAILLERLHESHLPLWPQVRFEIAAALSASAFGSAAVAGGDGAEFRKKVLRSIFPSRWDGASFTSCRDLLFIASGVTTYSRGAREHNWLVEGFLGQFTEQSVLMQWRGIPSSNGVPAFESTKSLEPVSLRSTIAGRLRRDGNLIRAAAASLVDRLHEALGGGIDPSALEQIARRAATRELARPHLEKELERLLSSVRPKIIFLEDASYGTHATLIDLAKRRGILVAEPQHGWIGPSHPAYNFGRSMRKPEFRQVLPDVLLSFGEMWAEGLRFPGQIVPIGKPHLESLVADGVSLPDRPLTVLVASSVIQPEATDRFVVALRDRLPAEWIIRFRPHPSERGVVSSRYPELSKAKGVEIDLDGDLYRSLRDSRAVVGVDSTVLFEAVKFGCQIFVRQSDTNPYYVGALLGQPIADENAPAEIQRRLLQDLEAIETPVERIWLPDASQRFAKWVNETVGLSITD